MNALTRWDRSRELESLRHGRGSLLGLTVVHFPEGREEHLAVVEWAPLVEISEDDQKYLINAEPSDVKKDDVQVTDRFLVMDRPALGWEQQRRTITVGSARYLL